MSAEGADIVDKFGNLYLNETSSDVTFIIGDEKLPAHQTILGQQCAVFQKQFLEEKTGSSKLIIELTETPIEAFKQLLKFIYTGTIDLDKDNIGSVLDVVKVAKTYEMKKLEQLCFEHLKSICTLDNAVDLINMAVEKSQETLIISCLEYIRTHAWYFLVHENFIKISVKALHQVFQEDKLVTSKNKIFHRLVDWMKANPSDSEHFPKLLRFLDLRTMIIDDLVTAFWPLKLIDGNDLFDIVYEQMQKGEPLDVNNRVALGEQKAVDVRKCSSDDSVAESEDESPAIGRAIDGNGAESIMIDLERTSMVNYVEMELSDSDWSYWIEVSDDKVNWTRIIDYSNYICRSVQRLYFKERSIRYIKIHGIAPTDGTFKIQNLKAYYTEKPLSFDQKTKIVIPENNVALAENNAIVIQGHNSGDMPNAMLNGNTLDESFTYHKIGKDPIIVQLPQPYLIDTIILCLHAKETCSYTIEVSTDKKKWKRVCSEKTGSSWQHAKFERQPVVFIKITGTYSTDSFLTCRHLDCHADTRP